MEGFDVPVNSLTWIHQGAHSFLGKRDNHYQQDDTMDSTVTKRRRWEDFPVSPGIVTVDSPLHKNPSANFETPLESRTCHTQQQRMSMQPLSPTQSSTTISTDEQTQIKDQLHRCFVCEKTYDPRNPSATRAGVDSHPMSTEQTTWDRTIMPPNALLQYFTPVQSAAVNRPFVASPSLRGPSPFVTACSFCERNNCCPDCWRLCDCCQHVFCRFCSTLCLSVGKVERTLCLECCHVQTQQKEDDPMQCG